MVEKYIKSKDGISIHYLISDTKPTSIVFVHGWLGNANWWKNQQEYFKWIRGYNWQWLNYAIIQAITLVNALVLNTLQILNFTL